MALNRRVSELAHSENREIKRASSPVPFATDRDFDEFFNSVAKEDGEKTEANHPAIPTQTFNFHNEMTTDAVQLTNGVDKKEDDDDPFRNCSKISSSCSDDERTIKANDDNDSLAFGMKSCHIGGALSDISSISSDYEPHNFLDFLKEEFGGEEEERIPTLDEIIATMPVDDPLVLSLRFRREINRDPEATVPQMYMPKEFTDLPIYLAEIFDPAHFWCHIVYSSEVKEARYNYDVFQKEMNETYGSLKEKDLQFSIENVKEGLICAGYFTEFKGWYRVKILKFDPSVDMAKVICIDYGTKGHLKRARLRYLFEDLLNYPTYCFRGRLYEIQPPLGYRYFKPTDVERFINAVSTNRFLATLKRYDEEQDAFEMQLIRNYDHIDMKEFVISQNIGISIDPKQYDRKICLGPMCYLLPTFEMLEDEYPTYTDLYEMELKGANFNAVVDSNFYSAVTERDVERNRELAVALNHVRFSRYYKFVYGKSPPL